MSAFTSPQPSACTADGPTLLTAEDVGGQLQVPAETVTRLALKGDIGSRKVGKYRRYTQADVDAYIERCAVAAAVTAEQAARVESDPFARTPRQLAALRRGRAA